MEYIPEIVGLTLAVFVVLFVVVAIDFIKIYRKNKFSNKLKQLLGEDSHEWQELTTDVFDELWIDFSKSGTFEEWSKDYLLD